MLSRSASFYVDHLRKRGTALYREACRRDLEGVIGKWARGRYECDGVSTCWLKIKNTDYSQTTPPDGANCLSADATIGSNGVNAGAFPCSASILLRLDHPSSPTPLYRSRLT